MEEKLSGIVLGGVNFSENDKILSIFTLEQGVVSAKIKGVKKAGAKLKFAGEPFCFAEFLFAKTGKNRTVTGASLIESFYPLRQDIFKLYSASTVLEFAKRFLKEGIVNEPFFNLVVQALKNIAFGDDSPELCLCRFLTSALTFAGYALNFNGCSGCENQIEGRAFFDAGDGCFYCENCKTPTAFEINYSTFENLQKITSGVAVDKPDCVNPLKLLDFYVKEKDDYGLRSLGELIKLHTFSEN